MPKSVKGSKRSRQQRRREAVFTLYQHDLTGRSIADLLGAEADEFILEVIDGVQRRKEEIDSLIERFAEGWTLERIAPLDLNVMRVAILEMLAADDLPGAKPITPAGAIDQAVELAKKYCSNDAPAFINGVLDAVMHSMDLK